MKCSMMRMMSDKDLELSRSIEKWYTCDKKGNIVLRSDAPQEVRDVHEMLSKKYQPIFD